MKITKYSPMILALAVLTLGHQRAGALDSTPAITLSPPNTSLDLARQLNEAFVSVAEKVSPTVVVITVEQKPSASRADDYQDDGDPLDPFRRFFRQRPQQDVPMEKATGQGSGIIIRKDGYILTNGHVVEDADKIEVKLKDGRTFTAQVRGVDTLADVAVIKIDAQDLPVATLADSDKTRVGEFAIAIGAPFALDYSVTFGHVSAKNRSAVIPPTDSETAMMDQSFIQTDANINPGNSGGPLVNIEGEVIGINTLIRGLHTGIGFAIPINMAREISDKLITDGKFKRPWLGISIDSLQEYGDLRELIERAVSSKDATIIDGVVVSGIYSEGPAASSKLHTADIISAVDGKPVRTPQQLKDEIRTKKVGQNVTLDVYRLSKNSLKPLKIIVQPGEWVDSSDTASNGGNAPEEKHSSDNALGLSIKPITPALAKKLNMDVNAGVLVTQVDHDGLAFQSGIEEGDIITSIDDHPVANARQFLEAMRDVDAKKGIVVHFISEGTAKFEILKDTPQ